ncbi:MAG: hypothetical protein IKL55_06570 [Clostridia bacterium]|nr:hypothetical protein [Clostridia bacterium]
MENNVKFALALNTLDQKIAELNIKISKDFNNEILKNELSILLDEKETLLKDKNMEKIEKIMNKYGSKNNE